MDKRVYQKYLKRSEIYNFEPFTPKEKIAGAVVIPALAEYDFLPETLKSLEKSKVASNSTIIVIVINSSSETSAEKVAENVKTLEALRSGNKDFCGDLEIGKELFWIDANSDGERISAKGGVGEARKIGMDSCLELFSQESFADSLFFCLDADTLVSKNYLSTTI
jgi:glycosyltransferase involved in cell wall biosynthesis